MLTDPEVKTETPRSADVQLKFAQSDASQGTSVFTHK